MLATDADGGDNSVSYELVNPDNFNFSISSEGGISNDDRFPTLSETEVRLLVLLSFCLYAVSQASDSACALGKGARKNTAGL